MPRGGGRTSKDELLSELRRVGGCVDGSPALEDMDKHGKFSHQPYYDRFGSWNGALVEAGFSVNQPRKITEEELLDELKRLATELGETPTGRDMTEHGRFGYKTYQRYFDSWNDALEKADLDLNHRESIERSELLDGLNQLATELGKTPTRIEMGEDGPFSESAYRSEFGTWNKALKAAGFDVNQPTEGERTTVECVYCGKNEERLRSSISDQKRVFCSPDCKNNWQEEEWGGEDHPLFDRVEVECEACGDTVYRKKCHVESKDYLFCDMNCYSEWCETRTGDEHPRWKGGRIPYYGPNWESQRRKALKRDEFECQRCHISREEHIAEHGRDLDIHHRQPLSSFKDKDTVDFERANSLENLITLCRSCHREWESLPIQPQTSA